MELSLIGLLATIPLMAAWVIIKIVVLNRENDKLRLLLKGAIADLTNFQTAQAETLIASVIAEEYVYLTSGVPFKLSSLNCRVCGGKDFQKAAIIANNKEFLQNWSCKKCHTSFKLIQ